ncbi:MAG: AAA family ATPase, partial [bacterium]
MKKLPIGIQNFRELITGNYLYIDKTESIYHLFANGGKYYFLSRPRRFGKSLLVSTLKEIFSGNRDLFKGLWIYNKIKTESFPIIHIDFSNLSFTTPHQLEQSLSWRMSEIASENSIDLSAQDSKTKFYQLIRLLAQKNKVVVLIDEYDKPIIDNIEKKPIAMENRDILRSFYSTIKDCDEYLKFTFLTGISKFARVSVFPGLNNLNDITIDEKHSTLLGYTEEELIHYFKDRFDKLATNYRISQKDVLGNIKNWYNGYSWDGINFVYNPYSILNLFEKTHFRDYWFSSGTPSFLLKLIKENNYNITTFDSMKVNQYIFESFDIDHLEIASLLFQTGYLTIKEKNIHEGREVFLLGYPNQEVKESFLIYLFRTYIEKDFVWSENLLSKISQSLKEKDIDNLIQLIKSVFSSIPYNIIESEKEAYYHTIVYLILKLIGIKIESEVQTNRGRIDAVIETEKYIY